MQTPWAILLCKFKDDDSEPYGPGTQRFQDLFTSSGSGMFNMVDFFRDMSHDVLDLSGSKVFGWYTLNKNHSDYCGLKCRDDLITWARQAAVDDNVDLSKFFSVVVCMNYVPTDRFGGGSGMATDDGRDPNNGMSSLSPSLLGQEMGHVYGLSHSRAHGSLEDYRDMWDVMSTANAFMGDHPYFTDRDVRGQPVFLLGPGLNAANMWSRGWLDLSRVWKADDEEFGTTVELRPLHRRDLSGYLVARVGQYFFEFRMPEIWDAGIGIPVVLVHEFELGNSYILSGISGNQGLIRGDSFQIGYEDPLTLAPFLKVNVISINVAERKATLQVVRRRDRRPRETVPGSILVGVTNDAGGLVIIGGKIVKIPPNSPLLPMVEALAVVQESESISNGAARDLLQRDALRSISVAANTQLQRMLAYREPAPPQMERTD
jgi:hypothetical protein